VQEELLTPREVAKYLKITQRTLYNFLKEGRLPAIKVGGVWRFKKNELDGWLEENKAPSMRAEMKTALVVEDHKDSRDIFALVIKRAGFQVEEAPDGISALALFKSQNYDFILVDLMLPNMNGLELIKEIKKIRPEQKIAVITAYPSAENTIEALNLGVFRYLQKPVSNLEILKETALSALH
jgi:excisionase family DNA binding protein